MKAVKLRVRKFEKLLFFPLPLIKQKENDKFDISIFFGDKDGSDPDYIPVFVTIRSDICKCWTNICHSILDYFLQNINQIIKIKIEEYETGLLLAFTVPALVKHNKVIQEKIRQDLGKIFESNKSFQESLEKPCNYG